MKLLKMFRVYRKIKKLGKDAISEKDINMKPVSKSGVIEGGNAGIAGMIAVPLATQILELWPTCPLDQNILVGIVIALMTFGSKALRKYIENRKLENEKAVG